jgi:NTE family protein
MQQPDVLVLGAGGTIGGAWIGGVLAGIAEQTGIDFAACERIVGTSAGSMVAADLLAGVEPRSPAPAPGGEAGASNGTAPLPAEDELASGRAGRLGARLAAAAGTSLAPIALSLGRTPGALVRAVALARVDGASRSLDDLGARIARHGLEWDGRLRIVCVDRGSGRRVVFGSPGAPPATVAEAVEASCSIPGYYRPVRIGEHEYVDGAVWSPTNMDAAPAGRETHVLCLAPMGGPLGRRERNPAVRAATLAALRMETLALQRRGAHVTVVLPDQADPNEHARITGFRQGVALARRS